jgi:hypothetical protein
MRALAITTGRARGRVSTGCIVITTLHDCGHTPVVGRSERDLDLQWVRWLVFSALIV